MRSGILQVVAVVAGLAQARDPAPVALESDGWLGIDGNWSTLGFDLGSNSQAMSVLVSTALSEFWVVGPGGCITKEPHCTSARGGVYELTSSKSWTSLGMWQLGLDYLGYGGNGDYGLDSLKTETLSDTEFDMSNVLMAAINTTDYFNGFFGLGITQGSFGSRVTESPLSMAVEQYGWIPSYSYGYTAGAYYRNMPVSLTLGGYDSSRFVEHDVDFTLGASDGMARPLVRGIIVSSDGEAAPDSWKSDSVTLSGWNTSFNALIDSTTPYLWLPDEICDTFAVALNLTYNDTLDLYTLSDDSYREYLEEDAFSFTFVLSSFDNTDDFGDPYSVQGAVNITIPSRAFVGLLEYPFMDEAIKYGDPAVPYFSLRRTHNSSTFIIGRSFLQESYLITKYDEGLFSIHQALFPDDPSANAEIVAIQQPDTSPYPRPGSQDSKKKKLTSGDIAGIVVGVVSACLLLLAIWLCYRRRQRSRSADATVAMVESKDASSSISPETHKSAVGRILSKITRSKLSPKTVVVTTKSSQQPSEVPNSEIYELPAPLPPVELDGDDGTSMNGDTELGTDSSQNMSAYDMARRKMERQLQGPVPAYSPPQDGIMPTSEKTIHDINPAPISAPPVHQLSPASSTRSPEGTNPNSIPVSLPSPTHNWMDWTSPASDTPSPMTSSFPTSYPNGGSTSMLNNSLPTSATENGSEPSTQGNPTSDDLPSPVSSSSGASLPPTQPPQAATTQRAPIDPSRVVFLGPLPGQHVPTRGNSALSHASANSVIPGNNQSLESLGSNFTEEEERIVEEVSRQTTSRSDLHAEATGRIRPAPPPAIQTGGTTLLRGLSERTTHQPDTPHSQERIDPGTELVHVPQLAEKRYSWEEDR